MPLPESLRARLDAIRAILMTHKQSGSVLPSAVKGSEREALVRDFLEMVFQEMIGPNSAVICRL